MRLGLVLYAKHIFIYKIIDADPSLSKLQNHLLHGQVLPALSPCTHDVSFSSCHGNQRRQSIEGPLQKAFPPSAGTAAKPP